jgi:DNA-binding response OmpR family regulator
MITLLVIDADLEHVQRLIAVFEPAGYHVVTAADGLTGLQIAQDHRPDLVILDLVLPGLDGYSVCRGLRKWSDVPIIILSDVDSELHGIASFALGVNQFVAKPFHPGELLARVRSLLYWHAHRDREAASTVLEAGSVRVDVSRRQVWFDSQERSLTQKEFDLLVYLMQHPGQILSRRELLDQIWPSSSQSTPRTIDVHIRWLREKLETDPSNPALIETVRGTGYRFTMGDELSVSK